MSLAADYDPPSMRDGNNPAPRSSQNKSQLLEATMRNVPKLKELNYTQWKNVIANSIKKAKLWGYVDGSIEEPSEHDASNLTTYFDEAAAVRNAILGSLESGAQKYIEEALDPREAWLALEKKYLTAEAEADSNLVSIEKKLSELRLEEGGDMIEHIAEFCRMRCQLNETRLALDNQASVSLLYRSLPPSYRQSVLTPEGIEMKDFSALCARLSYLSQKAKPSTGTDNTHCAPEDYACWGVPADIKAFGLTGDKNPLLEERAAVTCRDCLLKDHEAGTPDCPQYEWRRELWGAKSSKTPSGNSDSVQERFTVINTKLLSYEFSDPVKVVLDFNELGLRSELKGKLRAYPAPSTIQQCGIIPIIRGRNVFIQAPRGNGKTTALVVSILQNINISLPLVQAVVVVPTEDAALEVQTVINNFGEDWGAHSYTYNPSKLVGHAGLDALSRRNYYQIVVGTSECLLGLIHRNILKTHNIKVLALDDIDKIVKAGSEEQMFNVYQHVPPLAQIVASSISLSSCVTDTVAKLIGLVDPVRITVHHDEQMPTRASHYYLKVAADDKPTVLRALFGSLSVKKVSVLCRDTDQIKSINWNSEFYYLEQSMSMGSRESMMGEFEQSYRNLSTLIITDATLPMGRVLNTDTHLINYDVPNNFRDYAKRLIEWKNANRNQSKIIITFVTPDTHDMQILQEFERYYGVQIGELLWDGARIC
ncbi:ATP-dependent RNA helicase FAL1 [Ustilago maydis 521] [Rhizoctonia solani]|uniref:ATP-dependent RNA helicase n=1 Tax=Rhizoctonia solani TaxID=456999 RepID=A0A0K6FLL3_9AGAM|nr:ATP-dependent RNA helicase FAL1 [Ustilago maydis 521] [Rhizoctonia solani]